MNIICQVDESGDLPAGVEGGVWTRCATCHVDLQPPERCADHPDTGVDVRLLTAAGLNDARRAVVEAQLLAPIWDADTAALAALLADLPAGT